MPWPFGGLDMFGYGAIVADPPWSFEAWSPAGDGKSAKRHYACASLDALAALPVGGLARADCALFLWATDPMLPDCIRIMESWGFAYKTVAFTWAKRRARGAWHFGTGTWTRANPEICLLGTIGKPKRIGAGVAQLIEAPLREHSRKPDETFARVERLVGGPYAELFARTRRPGWSAWGDEVGKFGGAAA